MQQEQIKEWLENPVTIEVADRLASELEEIQGSKGLNAFHPFQPERTQEILANLNGYEDALELALSLLREGFSDEEDDGEAILE